MSNDTLRSAERRLRNLALVAEMKARPCADCGGEFPPECMDFDHLPGRVKLHKIARLVQGGQSIKLIVDEAAKCEVVCANCHRTRTKNQWVTR